MSIETVKQLSVTVLLSSVMQFVLKMVTTFTDTSTLLNVQLSHCLVDDMISQL